MPRLKTLSLSVAVLLGLAAWPVCLGQPAAPVAPKAEAPVSTTPAAFRTGIREPKPKAAGAIRVVSYNVENLFDHIDSPAYTGQSDDARSVKPDSEKAAVAEAIRRLDADVIGLQEVESIETLKHFRDTYLKGLGYDHILSLDVGDERGIEQAVLSRYPIVEAKIWPDRIIGGPQPGEIDGRPNQSAGKPMRWRRSPLCVTIDIPGKSDEAKPYELTLIVVHQKSGARNDWWREAEAKALTDIVVSMQKESPERNIVVLGDFNATPNAQSVLEYKRAGLVDPLAEGRKPKDTAFISHASGRTIDFVLLNAAVFKEYVPGSAFILATPQRPAEMDWRTTPTPPGYASDHSPVVIDLTPSDK
ncbi:MAG: endonuclease/exonuclease/phosphatase family protein [Phycisphaerales bacterium]|nr:endonuclease/exonuclease/phosphatase family protein [Phycisphaerales bacterium]